MLSYREGTIDSRVIAMAVVGPAESRDPGMRGHSWRGNREASVASVGDVPTGPVGKAVGRNPIGRSTEESDEGVVPKNPPKAAAEAREGRPETEGNPEQPTATGVQYPEQASSGLSRIREAAKRDGGLRFTSLMHHVTPSLLTEAYEALKRTAVPGVDGVTWHAYGEDLRTRIADLHDRVQNGRYRAQPSKRAWIPKADGRMRPLGIAALEDKVVQMATVWILNAIYEQDFAGFSYGFRPGRSQHQALDALWVGDHAEEGELDPGCGYPRLLRHTRSRVVDAVRGTPRRRSENAPSDP